MRHKHVYIDPYKDMTPQPTSLMKYITNEAVGLLLENLTEDIEEMFELKSPAKAHTSRVNFLHGLRENLDRAHKWSGRWQTRNGYNLHISQLTDEHLDNSINLLQKQLAKIDEEIKSIGAILAEKPMAAENVLERLNHLTFGQVAKETQITMMMQVKKERNTVADSKVLARSGIINIPAKEETKEEEPKVEFDPFVD